MKNQLKTDLNLGYESSNAILFEEGNQGTTGDMLGIIGCVGMGKGDITEKVIRAIKDHFTVEEDIVITLEVKEALTNQKDLKFSATWEEDEQELIRDFIIFVSATY